MPIKKAAIKALKQSSKKALKNFQAKKKLKNLIKNSQKFIEAKKTAEAVKEVKAALQAIDKALQQKVLKPRTGARKKSRLMNKLNLLIK